MKKSFLRNGMYAAVGGAAGMAVCIGVGLLIVFFFGDPPDGYIGVGINQWKLPGTTLGALTFWAIGFWLPKKRAGEK